MDTQSSKLAKTYQHKTDKEHVLDNPDTYTGFRYNDPKFNVKWPAEPLHISKKDLNFRNYNET